MNKKVIKLAFVPLVIFCLILVSCGQNKITDSSPQQTESKKEEDPTLKQLIGRWRQIDVKPNSVGLEWIIASGGKSYAVTSRGEAEESRYKIDTSVNPNVMIISSCISIDSCFDNSAIFKLDSNNHLTLTVGGQSIVFERISQDSALPAGITMIRASDSTEASVLNGFGSIGRSQQAFYLEKLRFSSNINEIQSYIGSPIERSKYYSYDLVEVNGGKGVQILLMSNHRQIRNYTGLVYLKNTSKSDTSPVFLPCKSNDPSAEVPKFNLPSNNSDEVQCPSGYSKVGR